MDLFGSLGKCFPGWRVHACGMQQTEAADYGLQSAAAVRVRKNLDVNCAHGLLQNRKHTVEYAIAILRPLFIMIGWHYRTGRVLNGF